MAKVSSSSSSSSSSTNSSRMSEEDAMKFDAVKARIVKSDPIQKLLMSNFKKGKTKEKKERR